MSENKDLMVPEAIAGELVDAIPTMVLCHLDGDRTNNDLANLAWRPITENRRAINNKAVTN